MIVGKLVNTVVRAKRTPSDTSCRELPESFEIMKIRMWRLYRENINLKANVESRKEELKESIASDFRGELVHRDKIGTGIHLCRDSKQGKYARPKDG